MPDNSYDLLRLPEQVLNILRRAFMEELGVVLEGPGGVGMYLFGDKPEGPQSKLGQYVLYNMSDQAASMKLRFIRKIPMSGWKELVRGRDLNVEQDTTYVRFGGPIISSVSIVLKPFEIEVVQGP
jgi:hypothetical protein